MNNEGQGASESISTESAVSQHTFISATTEPLLNPQNPELVSFSEDILPVHSIHSFSAEFDLEPQNMVLNTDLGYEGPFNTYHQGNYDSPVFQDPVQDVSSLEQYTRTIKDERQYTCMTYGQSSQSAGENLQICNQTCHSLSENIILTPLTVVEIEDTPGYACDSSKNSEKRHRHRPVLKSENQLSKKSLVSSDSQRLHKTQRNNESKREAKECSMKGEGINMVKEAIQANIYKEIFSKDVFKEKTNTGIKESGTTEDAYASHSSMSQNVFDFDLQEQLQSSKSEFLHSRGFETTTPANVCQVKETNLTVHKESLPSEAENITDSDTLYTCMYSHHSSCSFHTSVARSQANSTLDFDKSVFHWGLSPHQSSTEQSEYLLLSATEDFPEALPTKYNPDQMTSEQRYYAEPSSIGTAVHSEYFRKPFNHANANFAVIPQNEENDKRAISDVLGTDPNMYHWDTSVSESIFNSAQKRSFPGHRTCDSRSRSYPSVTIQTSVSQNLRSKSDSAATTVSGATHRDLYPPDSETAFAGGLPLTVARASPVDSDVFSEQFPLTSDSESGDDDGDSGSPDGQGHFSGQDVFPFPITSDDVKELSSVPPGGSRQPPYMAEDDFRLASATLEAEAKGSVVPLLKEELRYKILLKRRQKEAEGIQPNSKQEQLVDESSSRERRRMINRRSARRCRLKRNSQYLTLRQEYLALMSESTNLKYQVTELTKQKGELQKFLEDHLKTCTKSKH